MKHTRIELPPDETQPIGFVMSVHAHPGQATQELLARARRQCEESNIRIAVIHSGSGNDRAEAIHEALNGRIHAHTVVCLVHEPSWSGGPSPVQRSRSFGGAEFALMKMAQAVLGPVDETPGTLAYPATCCADDAAAAQSQLDQCIALCDTRKEALDKAHKWLPYRREVDAWSQTQRNARSAKSQIERTLRGDWGSYFNTGVEDDLPLSLNELGLTSLPPLPDGLTHLYAEKNCLTHVAGLPASLRVLDVSENTISGTLDLNDAKRLEVLMVSENRISDLVLDGFPCLRIVDASNNPVESLVLNDNHVIEGLDLWRTDLTDLPPSVMKVKERLNVGGVPLSASVLADLRARVKEPDSTALSVQFDQ